jgi:hypothetical protein
VQGESICGGTIRDICNSLPTSQAAYDFYDCVIVVVNMNQVKGKKGKVWQDDSDQGVEFMRLCIALRPFKRALIIAGGYGLKWNLAPSEAVKWDHFVSQLIGIANHVGIMATSGRQYYELMASAPDLVHLAQEQATIDVMVRMICDGVNALYGAKPAGSFATMQRLAEVDDLTGQPGEVEGSTFGSGATGNLGTLPLPPRRPRTRSPGLLHKFL